MIFWPVILSKLLLGTTFVLQSLDDYSTSQIQGIQKNQVYIVFQPQCHACEKQMQDLACLPEDTKVIFLGAFADEEKLRKEWRKLKTRYQIKYQAFLVDHHLKKDLKIDNSLTPQIFIKRDKELVTLYGQQSCKTLLKNLKD